jgi:sulfatase maturation enzyme AslB (radical SAM superfamily)
MYPVILKEADDFVILDAYYKGRWRCDEKALLAYLSYLSAYDQSSSKGSSIDDLLYVASRFSLERDYVTELVRQFESESMPRFCNFDPMHLATHLTQADDGILTPPTPIIEVTPYCNYHCAWCYIPPRTLSRNEFYSADQLHSNVVKPLLSEFGALEWCLTGGEPTLFPDQTLAIADLITAESEKVLGRRPKRMYMLTTGYDLSENIGRFGQAGINYYQVSLSSPNPERENLLRRSPKAVDSHALALAGIDAVVKQGLTEGKLSKSTAGNSGQAG